MKVEQEIHRGKMVEYKTVEAPDGNIKVTSIKESSGQYTYRLDHGDNVALPHTLSVNLFLDVFKVDGGFAIRMETDTHKRVLPEGQFVKEIKRLHSLYYKSPCAVGETDRIYDIGNDWYMPTEVPARREAISHALREGDVPVLITDSLTMGRVPDCYPAATRCNDRGILIDSIRFSALSPEERVAVFLKLNNDRYSAE